MRITATILALLLAGCATMSDEMAEKRLEYRENYFMVAAACKQSGGLMVVYDSLSRHADDPPKYGSSYKCTSKQSPRF